MLDKLKLHGECEMQFRSKSCQIKITDDSTTCNSFECKMYAKIDYYKNLIEDKEATIAQQKQRITEYCTLLLMPSESMLQSGEIDFTGIDRHIKDQRPTWDSGSIELNLYMLQFHQRMIEMRAEYIQERGLGKIKLDLIDKKKKESNKAIADIEKGKEKAKQAKAEANEPKPKTEYEKAVSRYTKLMGNKEAAEKAVQAMGLKP